MYKSHAALHRQVALKRQSARRSELRSVPLQLKYRLICVDPFYVPFPEALAHSEMPSPIRRQYPAVTSASVPAQNVAAPHGPISTFYSVAVCYQCSDASATSLLPLPSSHSLHGQSSTAVRTPRQPPTNHPVSGMARSQRLELNPR